MAELFAQRRIRHITSIQICNISPFPLRDSLASAIQKPSQLSSPDHHSDDLDLAISKRRFRRVSVNSVSTRRSNKSEGNDSGGIDDAVGHSKSEFVEGSSARHPSASTSSLRQQRPRTTSISLQEIHTISTPSAAVLRDSSQEALVNVITSRLVETCLAITVVHTQPDPGASPEDTVTKGRTSPVSSSSAKGGIRRSTRPSLSVQEKPTSRRDSTAGSRFSSTTRTVKPMNHAKSASAPGFRQHEASTAAVTAQGKFAKVDKNGKPPPSEGRTTYTSPVHHPSTNPTFSFDANFLDGNPLTFAGHKLRLEVWGRPEVRNNASLRDKGKDKEREPNDHPPEWKVIDSWFIDLDKLIPLTEDTDFQLYLPPNTPLITLSPFGQVYYLPSHRDTITRSPSPLPGYSSEPEYEAAKSADVRIHGSRKRHRRIPLDPSESPVLARTASYENLSKLVSLQSEVQNSMTSLFITQSEIGNELKADILSSLMREEQERNTIISDLQDDRRVVLRTSGELRKQIGRRSNDIQERRRMLALAQKQYLDKKNQQADQEPQIAKERIRLDDLRRRFTPTHTTLLLTLSTIFPIELSSLPDLLFAILNVPLPIPIAANDPAPPLSMPRHKDVTEDTVATALGYVAQLLQLVAAYLGKGLVYPVVCIGSRSLIKDNISAMVGPRMFPLFSKGVDTYRFEYGVFLLNKNIDMLMIDRDLRAMDMRHTLPNLKNLMLTLTHGEAAQLATPYSIDSPTRSLNDLEPSSETEIESTTPKASEHSQVSAEGGTPQASGATTPTEASTMTDASKSARPFLGLSTLTDLIRLRYPSTHQPRNGDPNEVDGTEAAQDGSDATRDGVAVSSAGTGEAREMAEDKLSLAVPATTALVPTMQGD